MTVRAAPTWGRGLPGLVTGKGEGNRGEKVSDKTESERTENGRRWGMGMRGGGRDKRMETETRREMAK